MPGCERHELPALTEEEYTGADEQAARARLRDLCKGGMEFTLVGGGGYSFDHLVGAHQQAGGKRQPKPRRRPLIDDDLECRGLLNWEIAGSLALQDSIDVVGSAPKQDGYIGTVSDEAAGLGVFAERIYRRNLAHRHRIDNLIAL